jgi:hypothetical protein
LASSRCASSSGHCCIEETDKGFTYIGAYLPQSFPLTGRRLPFFDCRLDSGKVRRTQTVVAVRGPDECFGPVRFGPLLKTEKVGEWALVYRPRQHLPLEEIDALLAEVQ